MLLAVAVTMFLGCAPQGRTKVKTAKVSGTVTLDGNALVGAQVNFNGQEFAGIATTDSAGHYEMEAQPGENKVFIVKYEGMDDPDFDPTEVGAGDAGGGGGPKQLVPEKYSDEAKSELKFTVPDDGADDANFDLTS